MAQIDASINGSVPAADNGVWGSLLTQMEEDAASSGNFYNPEIGKINQVVVITDPVRGMTNYKTQKEQRVQWQMFIAESQNGKLGDPKVWGIKAKSALTQLVAIIKANRLSSLVGATLQVVVAQKMGNSGVGFKDYTILLVSPPTPQIAAQLATQYPSEKLKEVGPQLFDQLFEQMTNPGGAPK
jgi:hypothetical protein